MNRLAVVAVAGGEPKILADKLDRGVSAPRFTPDGASILFLVADDASEYPGADSGQWRRGAAADPRAGGDLVDGAGQGRPPGGAGGDRHEVRRGSRAREQRTARADAPQRRADGRVQSGRHGGVQLQGEGRQRGPRTDCEAAGLCGREEVSDAAADSRRTERTGRALRSISSGSCSRPTATWWWR